MQIHYKEKALLANQYKIERAEKSKNWIGRNIVKVVLFGIFISVVGPVYEHQPDGIYRRKMVRAVDISDAGHLGLSIIYAVFYTIVMTIAYYVWKRQDEKQILKLKKHREQLLEELKLLRQATDS